MVVVVVAVAGVVAAEGAAVAGSEVQAMAARAAERVRSAQGARAGLGRQKGGADPAPPAGCSRAQRDSGAATARTGRARVWWCVVRPAQDSAACAVGLRGGLRRAQWAQV